MLILLKPGIIHIINELKKQVDLLEEKFRRDVKNKATYEEVRKIRLQIKDIKDEIEKMEKEEEE